MRRRSSSSPRARAATRGPRLNGLELACEAAGDGEPVTLAHAEDALQRRALLYDRQADRHYDTISAWIKATRGSDPDASLYYLAVMLEGGEDPRFIVRRMVVLASEDIGNADPQALVVATAAADAVEHVGPARVPVRARAGGDLPVAGAEVRCRQARGVRRPRAHPRARRRPAAAAICAPRPAATAATTTRTGAPGHLSPQELMPDRAIGARFYEPDDAEAALRERLERVRRARGRELNLVAEPRPPLRILRLPEVMAQGTHGSPGMNSNSPRDAAVRSSCRQNTWAGPRLRGSA